MIRILLGFIVILGIVWLYITNKKKEGLENEDGGKEMTSEEAQALAGSLKTQMAAAGVPAIALEETDALFAQLAALIETEVAASGNNREEIIETENVTPVENTVAPNIPFDDTSFFTGVGFGSAFCGINNKNPTQLKSQCSLLTAENCNATDCCIWVNGTKCVAGDANGPMEMNLDAKYYSHKYQCYGDCASSGTGGGNYGYGSGATSPSSPSTLNVCDDNRKMVPNECITQYLTELKCSAAPFVKPPGVYPLIINNNSGEAIYTAGEVDLSQIRDGTWGNFKKTIEQTITDAPMICSSVIKSESKSTSGDDFSMCTNNSMTTIPFKCIDQFRADLNCPPMPIPSDKTGTFPLTIGKLNGNMTYANGKVDISQIPNANWGSFKRANLTVIAQNPSLCSL